MRFVFQYIAVGLFFIHPVQAQVTDSVTFNQLLSAALEQNYGLKIVRNETEMDRLNNTYGRAGFLPVADANGTYSKSFTNSNQQYSDGRTREVNNAEGTSKTAQAEVEWTLFDGTRMFVTKEKLAEIENLGQINLQLQMEATYTQLASFYYQLIQEKKLSEVLQYNLIISKERYRLAEKKFNLGAASEIDVIQARLDMSADSTACISELSTIKNLQADINKLLTQSPNNKIIPLDAIQTGKDYDYSTLSTLLEQQNRELSQARSNERISYLEAKEAATEFSPTISAFGNYSYTNSVNQAGFISSNQGFGPTYGLRLTYPIFDGLNKRTDHQLRRIDYENAQLNAKQVQNNLQAELYKTFQVYQSALQTIAIEKVNQQEAQKNIDIAIQLYQRGQLNEIDFREIQRKLILTENSLLSAEYLAKISEIDLLRLTGQLQF